MHRHLRRPGTGVHDRARPARIAVPTSAAIGHGKGSLEGSLSVSGPVSRILSRAAIYLCGLPGPRRAGSTVLLGLAPGGVCLAAASPRRRCALTAPFHLCLYATQLQSRHRPCLSVALSRGFPRVGVTHRPALWCPDFPRGVFSPPAVRSAREVIVARPEPPAKPGAATASEHAPAAQTFRKTPTTLPSTLASVVRIGSISSFSGCSRMWSFSR